MICICLFLEIYLCESVNTISLKSKYYSLPLLLKKIQLRMFGTLMTIIGFIYIGWYGYNITKDLYFDKSAVVTEDAVEATEVDIGDELKDFTQYDANEDDKLAYARKQAKAEAAKKAAEQALKRQFGNVDEDGESSSTTGDNAGGAHNNSEELDVATMNGGIEADDLSDALSTWESEDNKEFNGLIDTARPFLASQIA